ncbi:hypothetical protein FA15DRAFT_661998 [Coprinopsis marcescibilis]|uniref:Uncharacterized protein n=1 Tax=Coprinopsis marcescibilis TaxID=230819 RepID=A0A5C3K9A6_COPMA|nr:hypothetical protein FA15DRAFT_661998 [Coprinopsis marcescibilis]
MDGEGWMVRDAAEPTQNGTLPLEDLIKVDEKSGVTALAGTAVFSGRAAPEYECKSGEKEEGAGYCCEGPKKGREAMDAMDDRVSSVGVGKQVRAKHSIEDLVSASDVEAGQAPKDEQVLSPLPVLRYTAHLNHIRVDLEQKEAAAKFQLCYLHDGQGSGRIIGVWLD